MGCNRPVATRCLTASRVYSRATSWKKAMTPCWTAARFHALLARFDGVKGAMTPLTPSLAHEPPWRLALAQDLAWDVLLRARFVRLVRAHASLDPARAHRVGQAVGHDRAQDRERRDLEDELALAHGGLQDEEGEQHRRDALWTEPGDERLLWTREAAADQ